MPLRTFIALPLALLVGACTYNSTYVPPNDGRARVVWRDGNPAAMVPASACRDSALVAANMAPPPVPVGYAPPQRHVYVHPIVWIDLPVYVPPHHHHHAPHHAVAHDAPSGPHRAVPANSKSSGGSSVSGGGDEAKLWVVAAVAALAVMPVIAVGLAVSDAEDGEVAAGSIDLVNAYNDLARAPDSPCPSYPPLPQNAPAAAPAPAALTSPPAPAPQDSPQAVVPSALPPPAERAAPEAAAPPAAPQDSPSAAVPDSSTPTYPTPPEATP